VLACGTESRTIPRDIMRAAVRSSVEQLAIW
jgi:hypothetical protein